MSEATLEELAYSLGIEKSVSAMSEAEKAQLRYIQIMKSSSDWQADMGKTLMSPANALRVVKQQFSLLTKAIGNVFIPIVMLALPYVVALTEMLTSLAKVIANFVSNILGIKIDFGLDDSSFGDITTGLEDIGTEADKTKNKLNTMLAPFDELNVVQEKSKSDGEDDGGLGGDLGVPLPTYDALSKLTDKFQKNIEKAKKQIEGLIPVILSVGAAFAAWKISKKLLEGLDYIKSLSSKDLSFSISLLGVANFLADFKRLKDYLDDIVKNGATFTNVSGLLSEFVGGIGDIFTILGKTKLGGSLKIIQGVGEIVSAISDISKNNVNWDNVTTIITGLTNVAIGIGVLTKNLKLAGYATALQGLTTAIEELHDNWDAIKKGDWSGVDKVQLVISGIQVFGGLLVAFDTFNKLKKGVNLVSAAENIKDLGDTTSSITKPTNTLTQSLKTLAKNLALGVVIIAEVSAAAILFAGAIVVLGKELDEMGKSWEPVLENGDTIISALGLGTALLVSIGTAAGLLGYATTSTGGTIPISIGVGTAMLLELGVATGLFIAEIWAIGKGLEQVGIAWQPVLDNGDTIKDGIELATALLIGIGVVTAALGTATVASVGLLPVAIGLGTALLVELSESTKKFVDSITKVAKQLNNNLEPQLELINDNASTITKGLNNYISFMEKLATIIFETTKVNVLSGFSGTVNKLISFFSGDPIKKFANDVNKTYDQTKDLNKKIRDANPELRDAIELTTEYLSLIKRLDSVAKNNKTSKLSGNLFTNMQTAGKNIVNGLVDGMNSRMSAYNSALNRIYDSTNTNKASQVGYNFGTAMADGINRGIKNNLLTTIQLTSSSGKKASTTYKIKAYAEGGYPDSADLFFANENGIPEMVGRIGNQTAVANNDQIATSLTNALISALDKYDFGGNNNPTTIYIGNKKVYEGYGEYSKRENDRYGTIRI